MGMENNVEQLKREIVEALKAERWEDALSRLEVWCERFPDHARSWLNRGYCLVRLERYREAVSVLDRCLEVDPSSTTAQGWRKKALAAVDATHSVAQPPPESFAAELSSPPAGGETRYVPDETNAPPTFATIAAPDHGRGWLAGTVVDGSGVDSEGVLQPHGGKLTLDADGQVTLNGGLAANLVFQDLRMDAGQTVIAGVLKVARAGQPFETLVVAVKSGSARPEILSPIPGSVLPGASATWKWTDNGNPVTEWWLTVGTSTGGADLYSSGSLSAVSREHTVSGLPTAGETVFVRLQYREDGLWLSSDVQYTAFTSSGSEPAPLRRTIPRRLARHRICPPGA